ncbi:MAG TPA: anti-sigma factor [Pseudonocardia sp.]
MTEPRTQCTRTEQAVGWALHALEPDEEMDVELHVPTCPDCRAAVHDTEAVMTSLATAVEQVDPPARLRASILEAAAATPQVPLRRLEATPAPPPRHRASSAPAGGSAPARPSRGGRRWSAPRRLVAAAAALAAVVVIGGLGARTIQLQQQLESANAQTVSTEDLVRQLARPGVSHALLAKTDGTAVAAVVLAGGKRNLYTLGLGPNANDHTYVLWGIKDPSSAPQPLGAFDVAPRDSGMQVVGAAGEDAFGAYAISLEPGRTPPASPTDVIASGALQT